MKSIRFCFLLIILVVIIEHIDSKRVCNDLLSYYIPLSPNCWNNKDGESNVTEIIKRWNASVEEHYLTTDDGYIILVVRAYKTITKSTPIIIGHGQHHNSVMFASSKDKSLAHVLVEAGYQVFLINYRGSRYSLRHVNKTANDRSFWNFGIHEMGIYDLRKCLSFVNETTGQKAIYVGYSSGTAVGYIYNSMFLQEAPTLLKGSISLAPLASLNKVNTPSIFIITQFWQPFLRQIADILFKGRALKRLDLEVQVCASSPFWWYVCSTFINGILIGVDYEQIDPVYKPIQILLFEDSIPIGLVDHFVQIKKAGVFQQFDYGKKRNLQEYGRVTPPPYRLSEVTVPLVIWGGRGDPLAPPANVEEIYNNFTNARCGIHFVNNSKWNTGDFIFGKDMKSLINIPLLSNIEDLEAEKECSP